jgi:hypothetical protein
MPFLAIFVRLLFHTLLRTVQMLLDQLMHGDPFFQPFA